MQFHQFLHQRDSLLRQARLANVAFAYSRLAALSNRIARSRLRGLVVLRAGDAGDGQPWPHLIAETASQAVIEEHFLEEDVIDLADIIAFIDEGRRREELCFRLEELASQ
ncbi:MAG TPA: hypothetical protein VG734_16200, partial [Lacunisphaera sp.]|nr:hypothetical protein [Lacunisphaera sp.]